MGLISKEVEIVLSGKNIKYYEDLGYKIHRIKNKWSKIVVPKGTKIKVKVSDLPLNSSVKVKVKCNNYDKHNDNCRNEYEMTYRDYNKHNHQGKIYCNHCGSKVLNSGENNYNYKNELTQKEREETHMRNINPKYTQFVKKVLKRDNYTCQCCGQYQGNIEVHHLDGYGWCKTKRTDETNGITLCHNCHYNFHSIYGRGNNTKEQFEEWFGKAIELLKYEGILPTARKIYCIEEDKVYDSAIDCARIINSDHSTIYKCCNHTIKRIKRKNKIIEYECKTVKGRHLLWLTEAIELGYIKTN